VSQMISTNMTATDSSILGAWTENVPGILQYECSSCHMEQFTASAVSEASERIVELLVIAANIHLHNDDRRWLVTSSTGARN